MSIVVSKFYCNGAGSDCPTTGFEVIRTKGESKGARVKKGDFILDSDLAHLLSQGAQVVVGFVKE